MPISRDAMLGLEEENRKISANEYNLQRWAIHFLLDGKTRVKSCVTKDVVEIPYE